MGNLHVRWRLHLRKLGQSVRPPWRIEAKWKRRLDRSLESMANKSLRYVCVSYERIRSEWLIDGHSKWCVCVYTVHIHTYIDTYQQCHDKQIWLGRLEECLVDTRLGLFAWQSREKKEHTGTYGTSLQYTELSVSKWESSSMSLLTSYLSRCGE